MLAREPLFYCLRNPRAARDSHEQPQTGAAQQRHPRERIVCGLGVGGSLGLVGVWEENVQ